MKDIPIEEVEAINPEVHAAAARVGCTHVSITGQIWPGGSRSGPPEEAARFLEFSWFKAAVVHGRAVFEDADPAAYAALLNAYGLGDAPAPEPLAEMAAPAGIVTLDRPFADPDLETLRAKLNEVIRALRGSEPP